MFIEIIHKQNAKVQSTYKLPSWFQVETVEIAISS